MIDERTVSTLESGVSAAVNTASVPACSVGTEGGTHHRRVAKRLNALIRARREMGREMPDSSHGCSPPVALMGFSAGSHPARR